MPDGPDDNPAPNESESEAAWDLGLGEVFGDTVEEDFSASPIWCGRFRLLEEIGRGGMGVVYRARDERLARDVAIKVIRKDRLQEASSMARFLEEAQIAGQLQHPGIVPIYETGLDEQDRPFFCMQLVEGEDLTVILKNVAAADSKQGHLINIFSRVCQTISFAHARGVIHRDLKPSNVMIGPFGEVQVLDWGFAKLIDSTPGPRPEASTEKEPRHSLETIRSHQGSSKSVSGSVLGTPGYMAPEQARGEVEELDERCDVFALGAILCEILTGRQPHAPVDGKSPAAVAAAGDMARAEDWITTSDGPQEMKDLAIWCLQPRKEDRPRNAFVVADIVASYTDALEESRHLALLEAQSAAHKLSEERRRRRLITFGSLGVIIIVIVAALLWRQRVQEDNRDRLRLTRDYRAAMDNARERSREKSWDAMDEALERARQILGSGKAQPSLRKEFALAREQFQRRKVRVELEAARNTAQQKLGRALEASIQAPVESPREGSKGFKTAFLAFGIDFDKNSAQTASLALRNLPDDIHDQALAALDEWAAREELNTPPPVRAPGSGRSRSELLLKLVNTAQLLDDSPWRRQLRDVVLQRNESELLRLARDPELATRTSQSLVLLALSLDRRRMREEAIMVLKTAFAAHPDDFWVNHHLSMFAGNDGRGPRREQRESTPDDLETALKHAWIAHALQPRSRFARRHLATFLLRDRRFDEAVPIVFPAADGAAGQSSDLGRLGLVESPEAEISFYRAVVNRRPDLEEAWTKLAEICLAAGSFKEAEEAALRSLAQSPGGTAARETLARALVAQGRIDAALSALDGQQNQPDFGPLGRRIREMKNMSASPRPRDKTIPGRQYDRAQMLTWSGQARAAAETWERAVSRARPEGPGRGPGARAPRQRGIVRDAVAALIHLAGQESETSEDRAYLLERAIALAGRALNAAPMRPGRQLPLPQLRELRFWKIDPRLSPIRDPDATTLLSAEQRESWQEFWNQLQDRAR